jgi:ribose 1,5-bisphosphokinase
MNGRLLLVVGPSGVGKDTLIDWAQAHAPEDFPLIRAHRYITRPRGPGEEHVPLTAEDFLRRLQRNCFSLHWQAHGCSYAIGAELDLWLDAGCTVLVNGSRAALLSAVERYPEAEVLHITASGERVAARLAERGREDADAIEKRLARAPALNLPSSIRSHEIRNDSTVGEGGRAVLGVLLDS